MRRVGKRVEYLSSVFESRLEERVKGRGRRR